MTLKKTIGMLALLLVTSMAYAEDPVKIIKKDCYSTTYRVTCDGLIKNTGKVDVRNVEILFTPKTATDEIADSLARSAYENKHKQLPGKDASMVELEEIRSTITNHLLTHKALMPQARLDRVDYLPSGDTVPFSVYWDFSQTKEDEIEAIGEEYDNRFTIVVLSTIYSAGLMQIDITHQRVK